jgi:hypothetical protein
LLVGIAIGYILGAKAGRERYEAIARSARRFAASQTFQSTAGVLQAQVDEFAARARGGAKPATVNGVNGHRH